MDVVGFANFTAAITLQNHDGVNKPHLDLLLSFLPKLIAIHYKSDLSSSACGKNFVGGGGGGGWLNVICPNKTIKR